MEARSRSVAEARLRTSAVLGVFTVRMALDAGLTRSAVRHRIDGRRWGRVVGTAYVDLSAGTPLEGARLRAVGATLCWPAAIVCLRTAAVLHQMPVSDDGKVHVLMASGRRGRADIVPHSRAVDPRDVGRMLSFRITRTRTTALDCCASLPYGEAERLMAWVRSRDILTVDHLAEAVVLRRHRPGVGQLRKLLAATGGGALSEGERLLHAILHDAGITGWVADQPIVVRGRIVARADVLLLAERLILEVDGRIAHGDFEADRQRLNELVLAGYTVLRFTWRQLAERPWCVREQIELAMRRLAR